MISFPPNVSAARGHEIQNEGVYFFSILGSDGDLRRFQWHLQG